MALIGNILTVKKQLKLNPKLEAAFAYLESALTKGSDTHSRLLKLPMDAFERFPAHPEFFALEQKFISKSRSSCFIESHKKFVDMQLIVSGIEMMEHVDIKKLTLHEDQLESRDLLTYKDCSKMSKIVLESGDLAIFFPEDAHLGCQKFEKEVECIKTVIKMPVEFF